MKIQCSKCGKKFDPDEHMYICPACGTYIRQGKNGNWLGRELTPEEQEEYDAKYNREPMVYDKYKDYSKDVLGPERLLPVWLKKTEFYKKRPYLAYVLPSICAVAILIFGIIYGINNI